MWENRETSETELIEETQKSEKVKALVIWIKIINTFKCRVIQGSQRSNKVVIVVNEGKKSSKHR